MRSVRVVLAVGVAVGFGALVVAAMQSCALPDYEVGTAADATVEGGGRRDAGADTHKHVHPREAGADRRAPPPRDSGARTDAKPDTAAGPGTCAVKTYPGPPSGPDVPGVGVYTMAVRSVDFGETDTTAPGYDLDYVCTCIDDGGASCVSPEQHCDYSGGVDNGAVPLLNEIEFGDPAFGSTVFSEAANAGGWSLVYQLSGYALTADGGVADDPNVELNVYVAPHPTMSPPRWDGTDEWVVSSTSVGDGGLGNPLYRSVGAYVSNHVLVAAIPEVLITMSGSTSQMISFRLSGGFITGTLTAVNGTLKITDGVISARWAEPDIFAAFGSYRPNSGQPFCTDNFFYPEVKAAICLGEDIRVNGSDPASLPCNALSIGIGFTAFPILPLATVAPPPMLTAGCPAATDPANDSCNAVDAGADARSPDAGPRDAGPADAKPTDATKG